MKRIAGLLIFWGMMEIVWAQKRVQPAAVSVMPPATSSIPEYVVQFSGEQKTTPLISPAWGGLVQCTSDGTMFVNYILPLKSSSSSISTNRELRMLRSSGQSSAYSTSGITGLYDTAAGPVSFGAGEDRVAMLLWATDDPASSRDNPQGTTVYTGEHHWYIAIFDHSGRYKSSFQVDIPEFDPVRIGVFDSGEILVLGVDRVNRIPKLVLFGEDGGVKQFLTPSEDLPTESSFVASSFGVDPKSHFSKDQLAVMKLRNSLGFYQITQVKGGLLLLEPGSDGPIFEARSNGALRTIPVSLPDGFVLDSAVPSNGDWFIRVRKKGTFNGKGDNAMMYEISAADGTPRKRILLRSGLSVWGIACVHDGKFEMVSVDGAKKQMILNMGSLVPASTPAQIAPQPPQ